MAKIVENVEMLLSPFGNESGSFKNSSARAGSSSRSLVVTSATIPGRGRIAVKVINHLGDEVMKVYRVEEDE